VGSATTVRLDVQGNVYERSIDLRDLERTHANETRRGRMLGTICATGAAAAVAAHGIRVAFGTMPSVFAWCAVMVIVSSLLAAIFLLGRGAPVARAATIPIAALVVGVPCLASQNGGMHAPVLAMAPTLPIAAGLFLGYRKALWVVGALAVEIVAVAVLGELGRLPVVEITSYARAGILCAYMSVNMVLVAVYEIERRAVESRLRDAAVELYQSSIVDPLTLVFNRRHFERRFKEERAYAQRHGTRVGVLLIDADHFKHVNDTYGHEAGDYVLKTLAGVLNDSLRAEDVLARFGGEEFVVLLRDASADDLRTAGERLRLAVEAHAFEHHGRQIPVTISLGGATAAGAGADESLLSLADIRLYAAKRAGRNCVIADGVFTLIPTSLTPLPRLSGRPTREALAPTALAS
jgi:diguanylate cyclase (GGDEF)-like protein